MRKSGGIYKLHIRTTGTGEKKKKKEASWKCLNHSSDELNEKENKKEDG